MDGKIYSIKLVHITGKVSCRYLTETNWGCDYSNNIQTILRQGKQTFFSQRITFPVVATVFPDLHKIPLNWC